MEEGVGSNTEEGEGGGVAGGGEVDEGEVREEGHSYAQVVGGKGRVIKRSREAEEVANAEGGPGKKRKEVGGKVEREVLVIGTSQIKHLAEGPEWQGMGWYKGWEVRIHRGGKVRDLNNTLMREEGVGGYKKVVILGGGNDASNIATDRRYRFMERAEVEGRVRADILDPMREMMKKVEGRGVVILLAPRNDLPEALRSYINREIRMMAPGLRCEVVGWKGEEEVEIKGYINRPEGDQRATGKGGWGPFFQRVI